MTSALFESDAYQREDGLTVFSRHEFASERFDYKPGEHVVFGGPTQQGKTSLAFVLLEYTATPKCPVFVAVSKPRDPVSLREGKRLNYRFVTDWPVPKKLGEIFNGNPSGYIIWPKYGDIDNDVKRSAEVTRRLLTDRYTAGTKHKEGILMLDDTMIKSKIMGLDREMVTILAMAGAMGLGQWTFVQKPTGAGETAIWSYGASEHQFLANDSDKRNRDRYDEIGGVDPKFVSQATMKLEPYQFLYIKRTGRQMCIVDSK